MSMETSDLPTPAAPPPIPEEKGPFWSNWSFWISALVQAFVVLLVLVATVTAAKFAGVLPLNRSNEVQLATKPSGTPETETVFLSGITAPSAGNEWWAARADHRLVASAVFNCKHLPDVTLAHVPADYFSALLLDLDPSGDHVFKLSSNLSTPAGPPLDLTNADQELLSLSDEIARARIDAAGGAETSAPWVQKLGWITVVVAALATLFVTLQGKVKPPIEPPNGEPNGEPKENWGWRFIHILFGPGALFRWVSFLAIALSITSTSLTGLKQVYDPTRTLTQNTRALLDLRKLHAQITMGLECVVDKATNVQTIAYKSNIVDAAATFSNLRAAVIPDYGAYVNLDLNSSAQNKERPLQSSEQPGVAVNAPAPAAEPSAPSTPAAPTTRTGSPVSNR
jgi:hypothetical protein